MDAAHQIARWTRQIIGLTRSEGPKGLQDVARRNLARWVAPSETRWPVKPRDIALANLTKPRVTIPLLLDAGAPLIVNWIMLPPKAGSGGHTTIFRMIRHLQARGHQMRVYFYDPYGGDHGHYARIVRDYFGFDGSVLPMRGNMLSAHAHVATSWPTAYALFNDQALGKCFYFVQDFEPLFHPAGAFATLAENTYRMGFHGITAGRWLTEKLETDYGMSSDFFNLGSDEKAYRRDKSGRRSGVALYTRSDTARRGTELGLLAMSIFAQQHPAVPIHLYGGSVGNPGFPAIRHGHVTPEQLSAIYNECCAGVSLSFSNVSLVPHEMLAAGCIPVVNDAPQNRLVLNNASVRYVQQTPHAIAAELGEIVRNVDFDRLSRDAAASVAHNSWEASGRDVEMALRRAIVTGGKARSDYAAEC